MTTVAQDNLSQCHASLVAARSFALDTVPELYGARASRASDLAEQIANAIAHVGRLRFVVWGDIRANG